MEKKLMALVKRFRSRAANHRRLAMRFYRGQAMEAYKMELGSEFAYYKAADELEALLASSTRGGR